MCIGAGRHEEPRSKCALSDTLDPAMPEFRISPVKIPVCSIKGAAPSRGGVSARDCPSSENGVEPSAYKDGGYLSFRYTNGKDGSAADGLLPKISPHATATYSQARTDTTPNQNFCQICRPHQLRAAETPVSIGPESIQTLSKKRRKHKVNSEASQ